MDSAPLLDVKELSIAFGLQKAVGRISFHINAGELWDSWESRGSGKSASLAVLQLCPHRDGCRERFVLTEKTC